MAILFETEEYRVTRIEPPSPAKAAVVTWMALRDNASATANSPFPPAQDEDFVSRAGLASLRVAARRNDWYQRPGHEAVVAVLGRLKAEFDVVITYGASMGGHAAIACAPLIGADCAVAFSPQASLSDDYMTGIGDPRWPDARAGFVHERIRDGHCRAVSGLIAFDPDNLLDSTHARTILEQSQMLPLRVRGGWHQVGTITNAAYGCGRLLSEVADACLRGAPLTGVAEAISATMDASLAGQLVAGNDETRRARLEACAWRPGPHDVDFNAILAAARRDRSPVLLDLVRRMIRSDRQRRQVARLLIDFGHYEDGFDLVLASGRPWNFYHPGAHAAIEDRAQRLGPEALHAERRRLLKAGDREGAAFLRSLAARLAGGTRPFARRSVPAANAIPSRAKPEGHA